MLLSAVSAFLPLHPTVLILGLFLIGVVTFFSDLRNLNIGASLLPERRRELYQQIPVKPRADVRAVSVPLSSRTRPPSFDYESFWDNAWQAALVNNQTLRILLEEEQSSSRALAERPCPKVFIYGTASSSSRIKDKRKVFGKAKKDLNQYHHSTDMFSFALILEYRLRNSKECFTTDPTEADLFYVPLHTKPKKSGKWDEICKSPKKNNVTKLLESLTHLTPATACRHFFVVSKGHYVAKNCTGSWYRPVPQIQNTLRLAYSHSDFICDKQNGGSRFSHIRADGNTSLDYPNLFSVPYPSSVHYSSKVDSKKYPPPWMQTLGRETLMLFIGSTKHGDTEVRKRIAKQCKSYDDESVCINSETTKHTKSGHNVDLATKGRSVFCLEPPGDSPFRKSLSDSITYGCVPVLFSNLTNEVAPWHWKKWREQGRVLVPREAFVTGEIDLKDLLESIPPQLLTLMQDTVRRHAREFQYSLEEDYDGIRITLDGLQDHAITMENEGVCSGGLK